MALQRINWTQIDTEPPSGSVITIGSNVYPLERIYVNHLDILDSINVGGSIIGSLYGTSSYSLQSENSYTASYVLNAISSSFSQTASFALNVPKIDTGSLLTTASFNSFTSSYNTGSFTGSFIGDGSGLINLSIQSLDTGSLQTTSSFNDWTGSIYSQFAGSSRYSMTASYVVNSQTASYVKNAQTASYVLQSISSSFSTYSPNYLPLTGGTINGNIILNGTASITYLNVTYESASLIYSSGSNKFGDELTDKHTFIGTVLISGSQEITGSLNVNGGIRGSLFGTSSHSISSSYSLTSSYVLNARTASYVLNGVSSSFSQTASYVLNAVSSSFSQTSSNILGGKASYIPYFITDTTLATSSLYQSGSGTIIINQDNATSENPEALYVWQPSQTSFNVISGKGNLNNYLQLNIQNTNQGTSGSSDVVATANNGNEFGNFIDMGINGENYIDNGNGLGGSNDAYLYSTGNNLHIGNATSGKPIRFFAGGTDTNLNRKLELNADGNHNITGSLEITEQLNVLGGITGSLEGTSSFSKNALSSSHAITSSFALSSSYALSSLFALSSSHAITSSFALVSSFALSSSFALDSFNSITSSFSLSSLNSVNSDTSMTASYVLASNIDGEVSNATYATNAGNSSTADYATYALNGGVTKIIAGNGISLPLGDTGDVTIVASSGAGGVTILSGSNKTQNFSNSTTWVFNHDLKNRTPIISVFDENYNQVIPENIFLATTSSAIITFNTPESGFVVASLGGTTGTVYSSSYSEFSSYSTTASYFTEKDPIFVAKSGSLATTGSNRFIGTQTVTGSLFVTSSAVTLGQFGGNQNGYVEFSVRNNSVGPYASGDIAVYANDGTALNNYIDMGINNSNLDPNYFYGGTDFGNAHDAYLYNVGGDLRIGNATSQTPFSQSFHLFSNPSATPNITITGSRVGINKSNNLNAVLDVVGNVVVTGSLTISGSTTIGNVLTLLPVVTLPSGQPTGSLVVSGSGLNCKIYFYNGIWNALF